MADEPTEAEITEIREIFKHFDYNENGTMDTRELAKLLTTLGGDEGADELDAALEALDLDRNGTIEFSEFFAWWSSR